MAHELADIGSGSWIQSLKLALEKQFLFSGEDDGRERENGNALCVTWRWKNKDVQVITDQMPTQFAK